MLERVVKKNRKRVLYKEGVEKLTELDRRLMNAWEFLGGSVLGTGRWGLMFILSPQVRLFYSSSLMNLYIYHYTTVPLNAAWCTGVLLVYSNDTTSSDTSDAFDGRID